MLNQLMALNPKKDDEYKTAFRGINILVKDIATCENLEAHYKKGYEKNKENGENANWLQNHYLRSHDLYMLRARFYL